MNALDSTLILPKILASLPHSPTAGQAHAIDRIANFLMKSTSGDTYLLKGYAGTGKTTIISAIVKALPGTGIKTVLMAPTGRAAKVMALYAKKRHSLYIEKYTGQSNQMEPMNHTLAPNSHSNTLFIVDEASMIADTGQGDDLTGGQQLLSDLLSFVKAGQNCRLLLVGDSAQLPPVGQSFSPALDIKVLTRKYGLRAGFYELTEVVRQETDSGILENATALRKEIAGEGKNIEFEYNLPDFERLLSQDLGEKLASDYSGLGPEEVVVICRSNRSANNYNRQIRYSGMWFEDELNAGDFLMCVKNNYFWLEPEAPAGFIANGDMLKVTRVIRFEEKFGFRFADLAVQLTDYPEQPAFEVKVNLDCLYTEAPALTREQNNQLYQRVGESFPEAKSKSARYASIVKDPWFQALQIKFAYAITCHKAQGGQWKNVFVDQGYLTDEMVDTGYLRWLYTAITRARQKIYLVNFHEKFFKQ